MWEIELLLLLFVVAEYLSHENMGKEIEKKKIGKIIPFPFSP